MFKISKTTEVKTKENRNNLTIRKRAGAITALLSVVVSSLIFFDVHIKFFAEVVCNTINFCNFGSSNHKDCFYVIYLISNNKYTKNNPFLLLKNNKFLRRTQVSNSSKGKLWKYELQKFADETGLTVEVAHFPPGTSKWNKIEHRLFSYISKNWRGKPPGYISGHSKSHCRHKDKKGVKCSL